MKFKKVLSKKVLSIDFGASEIKIVEGELSKKGPKNIRAFSACLPKNTYRDGEIINKKILIDLIRELLEKNKVSATKVYGIINSSNIVTRYINLPKVDQSHLSEIIKYQLNDILPIDLKEYIVQYLNMGIIFENKVEKFRILLIAMPKNIVLEHIELIREIGLKGEILDFQGNGIAKLINFNNFINGDYIVKDKVIVSIDIGYDNSKLTIIKNGKIELTKILDIGANKLYKNIKSVFDYTFEECEEKVKNISNINQINEEFKDYSILVNITNSTIYTLMENIENLIRYYRSKELGNKIDLIVLQGGLSNINGIDDLFCRKFKVSTIKLEDLDMLNWYGDLKKYSNAIGALIRKNEV